MEMLLSRETPGKTWRPRLDGHDKVTGRLKYLTDLTFPGMLYGRILRSKYPHAWVRSICIEKAKALPGVRAVLTHQDVPGLNRFGIVIPDQPVFCEEKVRFVGDAIAAVAAESEAVAAEALRLIEVEYNPLPVVTDPEASLLPASPRIHAMGNLLHRSTYQRGQVNEAFRDCTIIVEQTYETPRQMHAYLETEGGVVVPETDGGLTVYMGTQHGYRDRYQLARILALPENLIRIVSSPMGGSFGGKDELTVQPYGALLALASGRPVKIHQSRPESVRAGIKRHPMRMTMKTGADKEGHILAHQVRILADTGAYATLGPAVLDFAVEHATGPYSIENVDTEGLAVFTNNGVAGEFRGFGGNQVTFALEGQIERVANKLGIDSWELRRRNLRVKYAPGPLGQRMAPTNGATAVMETIHKSPLWNSVDTAATEPNKALPTNESKEEWLRVGIGMALTMHGNGLGFGRPDPAGGRLSLSRDGKIEIAFGFEEFGQGVLSVIEHLALGELGCAVDDLRILIGDTAKVPVSGSTTASRATTVVYHSLRRLKEAWKPQVLSGAAELFQVPQGRLFLGKNGVWLRAENTSTLLVPYSELAKHLGSHLPTASVYFQFPTSPDAVVGGHYLYSFAAVIARVEVDLITGRVKVTHLDQAVAAGPVVSAMGYLGQIEGGGVMALGFTLMEDAVMDNGAYLTPNFDSYLIPTVCDVPMQMNIEAIDSVPASDSFGPRGVGEIGTVAVAPAVAAAIHHATGRFLHHLPILPEEIVQSVVRRRARE